MWKLISTKIFPTGFMQQDNLFHHLKLSRNLSSLIFERLYNCKTLKISPVSYSISEETSFAKTTMPIFSRVFNVLLRLKYLTKSCFLFLFIVKFLCIFVILFGILIHFLWLCCFRETRYFVWKFGNFDKLQLPYSAMFFAGILHAFPTDQCLQRLFEIFKS